MKRSGYNTAIAAFVVGIILHSPCQALTKDQITAADLGAPFDDIKATEVLYLQELSASIVESLGCSDSEEKSMRAVIEYLGKSNAAPLDSGTHFGALTEQLHVSNRTQIPDGQLRNGKVKLLSLMQQLSELLRSELYSLYDRGDLYSSAPPTPKELAAILKSYRSDDTSGKNKLSVVLQSLSKTAQAELNIGCGDDANRGRQGCGCRS